MLTFLVLRTLYVATLQRSLVLLLHYMLLRSNKSLVFSGAVATRTLYVATLLVMGWGGGGAC